MPSFTTTITLSGGLRPRAAVWRYDPVLFTSKTDLDFHVRNFSDLATSLEGSTDEVVVSFAQIYRKTKRNMNRAAAEGRFEWEDPPDEVKCGLASELVAVASRHRMQLTMCSQSRYIVPGACEAHCVSSVRLADIAAEPIRAERKGNRPDCACDRSRDIGDYDTCPHGCVYCYAVLNKKLAQTRFKHHDPDSEFLFEPEIPVTGEEIEGGPFQVLMFE